MLLEKAGKANYSLSRDKIWCDLHVKKRLALPNDADKQTDSSKCLQTIYELLKVLLSQSKFSFKV